MNIQTQVDLSKRAATDLPAKSKLIPHTRLHQQTIILKKIETSVGFTKTLTHKLNKNDQKEKEKSSGPITTSSEKRLIGRSIRQSIRQRQQPVTAMNSIDWNFEKIVRIQTKKIGFMKLNRSNEKNDIDLDKLWKNRGNL